MTMRIQPIPQDALMMLHEQLDSPHVKLTRVVPCNDATREHFITLRVGPVTINLDRNGHWSAVAAVTLQDQA